MGHMVGITRQSSYNFLVRDSLYRIYPTGGFLIAKLFPCVVVQVVSISSHRSFLVALVLRLQNEFGNFAFEVCKKYTVSEINLFVKQNYSAFPPC